ncbi:MAG: glycerol-3-phosphate 1-O-acyltransferase PlsY [bacterium]|nr:glycerol-3-phosphate 1-O-acyltransferase PlsY [bacterium]
MILLYTLAAYLIGSVPSAYVLGKTKNIDITKLGSGNVGGTNAFRVMGWKAGLFVALFDVMKAVLPIYVAANILRLSPWELSLIALAVVVGHSWSIYIGFKGGKGIATIIGVSLVLFPQPLFVVLLLAVTVIAASKFVSLGSIVLVTTLPIYLFVKDYPSAYIILSVVLGGLSIYRHRENIDRLLKGKERKVGEKSAGTPLSK